MKCIQLDERKLFKIILKFILDLLTNSKAEEESHDDVAGERGTERCKRNRDGAQDKTAVVQEQRIDGWEVGNVSAENTSERVGDSDN